MILSMSGKKVIVVTSWDDGLIYDKKLYETLDYYGIKGTFFVIVGKIGKPGYLSEDLVKEISLCHEVGSHTLSHPNLTNIDLKKAEYEIYMSKCMLEKIIGSKVYGLCYPKGYYNSCVATIARKYYIYARTIKIKMNIIDKDLFHIHTLIQARDLDIFSRRYAATLLVFKKDPRRVIRVIKSNSWDKIAIELFDFLLMKGGIFHLWGHSYEIEKNNDWKKLENILSYIAWRSNVEYMTLYELCKYHSSTLYKI